MPVPKPLPLPRDLVAAAEQDGRTGWLATLPATVARLARAWSLTVEPLLRGQGPTWSAVAAGGTLRQLVADVVQGGLRAGERHGAVACLQRAAV